MAHTQHGNHNMVAEPCPDPRHNTEQESSGSTSDRDPENPELPDVVECLDKLDEVCVAKTMTYEEESQRRAAEQSGNELKEALFTLSEGALLPDPAASHHPSARNVSSYIASTKDTIEDVAPRLRAPARTLHLSPVRLHSLTRAWRSECREITDTAVSTRDQGSLGRRVCVA